MEYFPDQDSVERNISGGGARLPMFASSGERSSDGLGRAAVFSWSADRLVAGRLRSAGQRSGSTPGFISAPAAELVMFWRSPLAFRIASFGWFLSQSLAQPALSTGLPCRDGAGLGRASRGACGSGHGSVPVVCSRSISTDAFKGRPVPTKWTPRPGLCRWNACVFRLKVEFSSGHCSARPGRIGRFHCAAPAGRCALRRRIAGWRARSRAVMERVPDGRWPSWGSADQRRRQL